jgi:quercetin dioxygenase-like cupin family protein
VSRSVPKFRVSSVEAKAMTASEAMAFRRNADNAQTIRYMGEQMTLLATGKDNDGQYALIEATGKRGAGPPLHVHAYEDELFYVLEGELKVTIGDQQVTLPAGSAAFLPRGIAHTFRVMSPEAKGLVLITPAGFENYFVRMSEVAAGGPTPEALEAMVRIGGEFGIAFPGLATQETSAGAS